MHACWSSNAIKLGIGLIGLAFLIYLLSGQLTINLTPSEEGESKYELEVTVLSTDIEEEYTAYGWEITFIVNVKINNTGSEELYVSYGDFYILTKDKRKMSSTWTQDAIFLEKLPTGTWTSGKVAFDYNLSEISHEDLDKLVFEKELFGRNIYFEWNISDLAEL